MRAAALSTRRGPACPARPTSPQWRPCLARVARFPARRRFQGRLLAWYRRHRRDLPWRQHRDPYHILVSEIMLQQTQVERVVPKYRQFLGSYPTLEALAQARPDEVRRSGIRSATTCGPLHLQAIARETIARYGGGFPRMREP